jgi:hypothetical protein
MRLLLQFIYLPGFEASAAGLLDEAERHRMERWLLMNPEAGTVLRGTGGVRKMRVPRPGHGKRGGARVIYYYAPERRCVYLLYAYGKRAAATLSPRGMEFMRTLAKRLREEL